MRIQNQSQSLVLAGLALGLLLIEEPLGFVHVYEAVVEVFTLLKVDHFKIPTR